MTKTDHALLELIYKTKDNPTIVISKEVFDLYLKHRIDDRGNKMWNILCFSPAYAMIVILPDNFWQVYLVE